MGKHNKLKILTPEQKAEEHIPAPLHTTQEALLYDDLTQERRAILEGRKQSEEKLYQEFRESLESSPVAHPMEELDRQIDEAQKQLNTLLSSTDTSSALDSSNSLRRSMQKLRFFVEHFSADFEEKKEEYLKEIAGIQVYANIKLADTLTLGLDDSLSATEARALNIAITDYYAESWRLHVRDGAEIEGVPMAALLNNLIFRSRQVKDTASEKYYNTVMQNIKNYLPDPIQRLAFYQQTAMFKSQEEDFETAHHWLKKAAEETIPGTISNFINHFETAQLYFLEVRNRSKTQNAHTNFQKIFESLATYSEKSHTQLLPILMPLAESTDQDERIAPLQASVARLLEYLALYNTTGYESVPDGIQKTNALKKAIENRTALQQFLNRLHEQGATHLHNWVDFDQDSKLPFPKPKSSEPITNVPLTEAMAHNQKWLTLLQNQQAKAAHTAMQEKEKHKRQADEAERLAKALIEEEEAKKARKPKKIKPKPPSTAHDTKQLETSPPSASTLFLPQVQQGRILTPEEQQYSKSYEQFVQGNIEAAKAGYDRLFAMVSKTKNSGEPDYKWMAAALSAKADCHSVSGHQHSNETGSFVTKFEAYREAIRLQREALEYMAKWVEQEEKKTSPSPENLRDIQTRVTGIDIALEGTLKALQASGTWLSNRVAQREAERAEAKKHIIATRGEEAWYHKTPVGEESEKTKELRSIRKTHTVCTELLSKATQVKEAAAYAHESLDKGLKQGGSEIPLSSYELIKRLEEKAPEVKASTPRETWSSSVPTPLTLSDLVAEAEKTRDTASFAERVKHKRAVNKPHPAHAPQRTRTDVESAPGPQKRAGSPSR